MTLTVAIHKLVKTISRFIIDENILSENRNRFFENEDRFPTIRKRLGSAVFRWTVAVDFQAWQHAC